MAELMVTASINKALMEASEHFAHIISVILCKIGQSKPKAA